MNKVREYSKNPLYVAIAAGIVGLLIGWLVLGWGIWPVTYTDTDPSSLRDDFKQDYARMAVDSFAKTNDTQLAIQRFKALGPNAATILSEIKAGGANAQQVDLFAYAVSAAVPTTGATPVPGQVGTQPPAATGTATPSTETGSNSLTLLLVLCLVLVIIGGALAYLLIFRGKRPTGLPNPFKQAQEISKSAERTDFQAQGVETPIAQFMTTYKLGVDLYDDSFSIDSPTGEFLGECGVGISDTVGVGDPKKVTAFEVWLFDKNDIQTVTKVLMSEYAFKDPTILQRLASKGEPLMIEPGKQVLLETATLQLEARIVDMNYGTGALPANSFFDRLTLELAVWPKTKA
jgi:hypothetical protein